MPGPKKERRDTRSSLDIGKNAARVKDNIYSEPNRKVRFSELYRLK